MVYWGVRRLAASTGSIHNALVTGIYYWELKEPDGTTLVVWVCKKINANLVNHYEIFTTRHYVQRLKKSKNYS